MATPFEIGRGIGNNISGAFQKQRDYTAIDEILEQANEKGGDEGNRMIGHLLARVSPQNQPLAINLLKQRQEQIVQKKSLGEQRRLADEIESAQPGSSMHKLVANIYRSDLPIAEKEKMIKSISGSVPFKAEQQNRLQLDSVLKRYNSRIKEVDASLKATFNLEERKTLEKQKKDLQKERDLLLNFKSLQEKEKELDDKEKELDDKTAEKIMIEAGGDPEKAREIAHAQGYKF